MPNRVAELLSRPPLPVPADLVLDAVVERSGSLAAFPSWTVRLFVARCASVERRDVAAWSVSDPRTAERLLACAKAGKAYTVEGVREDVNGATYVAGHAEVFGFRMLADLRERGF